MEKLKLSVNDIVAVSGESRSNVCKAIKQGHLRTSVIGVVAARVHRRCALGLITSNARAMPVFR